MQNKYETITEESAQYLVNSFYAKVRADQKLAPVFEKAIGITTEDWQPHLELISKFWAGIMLGMKGYQGNPLKAHRALPPFDPALFSRWLAIFANTALETHGVDAATAFIRKAVSIAEMMSRDLFGKTISEPPMPCIPSIMQQYRTTPVFQAAKIPDSLRRAHKTAAGVFGRIIVSKGRLLYTIAADESHVLMPEVHGIIEPERLHFVTPLDDAEFVVEFYKDPLLSLSKGTSSS